MDFSPHRPRRIAGENIVPMINVVFLLLIFFLMSAQIAPAPPVDVTNPNSSSEDILANESAAFVSSDGDLYYSNLKGEAAIGLLATAEISTLSLHVDATLPATKLATLLARLTSNGVPDIEIVTRPAR